MRARNILCFLSICAGGLFLGGPAQAADTCTNAAFRAGASASLPDCRAYEQVSPVDKSGTDVLSSSTVTEITDGKVYFNTSGSVNNSNTVLYDTAFLASRGTDWTTQPLDPPTLGSDLTTIKLTLGISADATKAVVVTRRALAPGAIEGGSNLYIRDLATDSYRLIVTAASPVLFSDLSSIGGQSRYLGATDDLSTIAFASRVPLTADAPPRSDQFAPQYGYVWRDGQLRFVTKTPGGQSLPLTFPYSETTSRSTPPLSADGTRLTFQSGDTFGQGIPNAIYQYVWGEGTTLLSPDERQGRGRVAVGTGPAFPSADGKTVYFAANDELTDQPHPSRFYRWSAQGGALTPVAPNAKSVLAVSPDARYVYYTGSDPNSPTPAGGVWVYDTRDGVDRLIANTEQEQFGINSGFRMSPDGHRLLFVSFSPITGLDNANPSCKDDSGGSGFCGNLFTYDADTPAQPVVCVSCTAGRDRGRSTSFNASTRFDGRDNRPITDDGRVFFNTPNRLVGTDTNAVNDVYEYRPGASVTLLSPGNSGAPAVFQDASADGDDVYFTTTDRLVAQDSDSLADLYTARVGGGIGSQQVAPAASGAGCSGEACRPGSAVVPPSPARGSADFRPSPRAATVRFSVARLSTSTLRAAGRSGRLSLPVRVNRAGRVSATLRGRIGGRTRTAGSATARASRAGTVRLTLRLSKAARSALRRDGKLRLTLTVRFSGADKPSTRSITLTSRGAR